MPRKAKITAVPIDDQPDLAIEKVDEQEPKPDAEKMTDVLNEVNVADNEVAQSAPAAPKAKARRVSKKRTRFHRARSRGNFIARRSASGSGLAKAGLGSRA